MNRHPDLLFALRGGGNNFGIVTRFTVRAVAQGKQLVGARHYALNYTERVLAAAHGLAHSNDSYMSYWTRYAYNQSADAYDLSLSQAYFEPVLDPPVFAAANAIPALSSDVRIYWMSNFAVASASQFGNRYVSFFIAHAPCLPPERLPSR
ncbi:hypothetical protein SLS55_005896 [Diplodia seriata]|uniref:Uncharacterized protein n=1 Tax=Diplodia seriata TaxID=420778 RepID=A0ABR3CHR0_9PEZI